MPAYFSVNFIISKKNIYENIVMNFYQSLLDSGLVFFKGAFDAEGYSMNEIAELNQKKLYANEEEFEQIYFKFQNFKETRVFLYNLAEEDYFMFVLIIPESEFIMFDYKCKNDFCLNESIMLVEKLMVSMWERNQFLSIQTGWEIEDDWTEIDDIISGVMPNVTPYAIIPTQYVREEWHMNSYEIVNCGSMLVNPLYKIIIKNENL